MQLERDDQPWGSLLETALLLIEDAKATSKDNFAWTFGGGTVLMFHFQHRISKDIDIFLTDPQLLGFFNPKLSDFVAKSTSEYQDSDGYIKLLYPQGEVDFIVAPPATSCQPSVATFDDQELLLEHPVEIVAKKLKYRAKNGTGRDLFDLAATIEQSLDGVSLLKENYETEFIQFLDVINSRIGVAQTQYENLVSTQRRSVENDIEICTRFLGK